MSDGVTLERRLAQAEELLNILDALRPDIPAADLYELALQMLLGISESSAGSLWIYGEPQYQCMAWYGVAGQRAALLKGASLDEVVFQQFLSQFEARSGMHWCNWPLPATTPEPLQPPGEGHTLILPLAFMNQIGFAALESTMPPPDDDTLLTLGRFGDKIAVALDTARVFQQQLLMIDELRRLAEEQRQLQATVFELSAPLLPLLPGVLVLPLVGTIDAGRAERILEAELEAIIKQQAAVVLVDITGVPVVDTGVAMQLIRSAEAGRLLGCRTILVGVKPEIAQTLVGLGIDLRGITTRSTLADGLQEALRVVQCQLVMIDKP